jgi:SNARE associated Golgi protein
VKRGGLATGGWRLFARHRWVIIGVGIAAAAVVAYCVWLVLSDAPAYRLLVRLYGDRYFLKQTLRQWGILAPVIFIALQALQVIIAPIPGEVTGILGGYLFGEWLGLIYSTVGLTVGSVAAFGVGRWLGAHYVRALVSQETWDKMGFILEAEGHSLLHHLPHPRPAEGHGLLSLRDEPHAGLGLCSRLQPRAGSRDVGLVGSRRSYGGG